MQKTAKKTAKSTPVIKAFNIRMQKDLWYFLKKCSLDQEISINEIVNKCLNTYRARRESV